MDEPCRCHHVRIWHVRDGYAVVLTCQADAALSVAVAHRLAVRVRKRLQSELSQIHQVLVDLEPEA
jgi:divalent metal cation (Fe/Co/Zn/Cd) transporter